MDSQITSPDVDSFDRMEHGMRGIANDLKKTGLTSREKLAEMAKLVSRYRVMRDRSSEPTTGRVYDRSPATAERIRHDEKSLAKEILSECGFQGEDLEARTLLYFSFLDWMNAPCDGEPSRQILDKVDKVLNIILKPQDHSRSESGESSDGIRSPS